MKRFSTITDPAGAGMASIRRERPSVRHTQALLAQSALLTAELASVLARSRAISRRAQTIVYARLRAIAGGSDAERPGVARFGDDKREQILRELVAMQHLQEVSTRLIQGDVVADLYDPIMDAAVAIMGSDFATLQMLYPDVGRAGELRLIAHRGLTPEAARTWEWVRADQSTSCGAALRLGRRYIVTDTETSDLLAGTEDLDAYRQAGIQAVQSTPLYSRAGSLLGMISTHWREPHEPQESQLHFLDILARQAADIVERIRSEHALREVKTALEEAQRLAHIGSWHWDAATDVATGSAELLRIFGFDPATQTMPPFREQRGRCYSDADWGRIDDAVQHALATGEGYELDVRVIRADGTDRWVTIRSEAVRDDHGRIIGLRGTVQDIDPQKRAELVLREANERKDEFLAMLSHELRTPLTSIVGWARLLQTRDFDADGRRRALEVIERNAKLQTALVEDLLDISRFARGDVRLDLQPVELSPVIAAAIDSVQQMADAKVVTLEPEFEATMIVPGDPRRLQQVIGNLLTNAVKFTPEGGRVRITLARADGCARIIVTDTGPGIPDSVMPHIFEAFRQGEAARGRGGLGLGLAIVRRLVEHHGGRVDADGGGNGRGATFTITLPAAL
jgi:signal transduction histidine kinase